MQYCPNFGSEATLSPLDSFVTWDTAGDVDDFEYMCSGDGKPGGAVVRSDATARFLLGGGVGCELKNNFWAKVWGFDWWGGWREGRLWRRRRLNDIVAGRNQFLVSNYPSLQGPGPDSRLSRSQNITMCCWVAPRPNVFVYTQSRAAFFVQRNETSSWVKMLWSKHYCPVLPFHVYHIITVIKWKKIHTSYLISWAYVPIH